MQEDLQFVIRKRYVVNMGIRGGATILFLLGAIQLLELLFAGFVTMPYYNSTSMGQSSTQWNDLLVSYLPSSGTYIFPAVLLLAMQRSLATWLAPLPKPQCPKCGYETRKLTEPRCPECGFTLAQTSHKNEVESDV